MSKKPISRPQKGITSIYRVPLEGYITPRLKQSPNKLEAIGFRCGDASMFAIGENPLELIEKSE